MQREKNTLSCQLDQGTKRVKQLEEEKQNIEQNLTKSRTMVDDLKSMFLMRVINLIGTFSIYNLLKHFQENSKNAKNLIIFTRYFQ